MLLQLAGLIGMVTMLIVCIILALPRNTKLFIVVGQSVFAWLTLPIAMFAATRLLSMGHVISASEARAVNSTVFIIAVIGIVLTVARHDRTTHQ